MSRDRKMVRIESLKGIKNLEFPLPEKPGVYLLAGENGAGKTTLLSCLDRICNSQAFRQGFPIMSAEGYDSYDSALVSYIIGDRHLTYSKKGERWVPSPKKSAKDFLEGMGFSSSIYARADTERINVRGDDILPGKLDKAPSELVRCLSRIFDDDRFDSLQLLENKNGRRWFKHYYVAKDESGRLYTEKRFSSGELAVLRLLGSLLNAPERSLILFDEAELALHPKVQRKLYSLLCEKAKEHKHCMIVATHSNTLIEECPPSNILLLRNHGGVVSVVTPCYPAEAMQNIDVFTKVMTDNIILLEDDMAVDCFKLMHEAYAKKRDIGNRAFIAVPVGGFNETAKLAINLRSRIPERTHVKAVLDDDAFDMEHEEFKKLYAGNKNLIVSLGITPEVYLVNIAEENMNALESFTKSKFNCSLCQILSEDEYLAIDSDNPRKKAKRQFGYMIERFTCGTQSQDVVQYCFIAELINFFDDGMMGRVIGLAFSNGSDETISSRMA